MILIFPMVADLAKMGGKDPSTSKRSPWSSQAFNNTCFDFSPEIEPTETLPEPLAALKIYQQFQT